MKIQEKPDYLVFADSAKNGECTNFPDVSRGWGVTIDQTASKPPMEWMNGAFNRVDKNMLYLLQQGIPEWCEYVKYPVNAIIKYKGVLYTAIVENDNAIPTSDKWEKTIAEVPTASTTQKGVVKLSSATNSLSETEAATPKAVKTAYDNVTHAHARINDTNNLISNITDRLRYLNASSQLWTANKRYVFAVRDDAAAGVFDVVNEKFIWCFNETGLCAGSVDPFFIKGLDKFVRDRTPPVGVPMPWPQHNPPAGWFECNGSAFDKNQFQKLAAAYPSGKLPDLRGEFIRGWDNGRGADPGRNILGLQTPQISAHRHVGGWGENTLGFDNLKKEHYAPFGSTGANGVWCGAYNNDFDNGLLYTNDGTNGSITTSRGTTYWDDLNPAGLVGHETRPRNIAFMYIVKAE